MTAHRHPIFTVYCRMTAIGGSEQGECTCKGPKECRMRRAPAFNAARNEATTRVRRIVLGERRRQ